MTEPAIRVENISKLYRLGTIKPVHDSLKELVSGAIRNPLRKLFSRNGQLQSGTEQTNGELPSSTQLQWNQGDADDSIWALKDISFEVQPGEILGIIGRNGAGKSTLLKILSRITEPSSGRIELNGRVASLLEVGTGFHPELTGRENIFLNGAILGMKRQEIKSQFDEIVDYAEIEHFIDTPVKRYSSGMYTRLAFAVGAHLRSEILLVDEVLAVGDAAFQRKCLGKIGDVASSGRTVVFISHNMSAIKSICGRTLWLYNGKVRQSGWSSDVVDKYMEALRGPEFDRLTFESVPTRVQFLEVAIAADTTFNEGDVILTCKYIVRARCPEAMLCVEVHNNLGTCVYYANDEKFEYPEKREVGKHECVLKVPMSLFASGTYEFLFGFWTIGHKPEHAPANRLTWNKTDSGTDRLSRYGISSPGVLCLTPEWHVGATPDCEERGNPHVTIPPRNP